MHFDVLTIFPEMFQSLWAHGIIRRALAGEKITARTVNIRDFAKGRHRVTDDRPFGGGCGMVMKPEPLGSALGWVKKEQPTARTVLLTPQGRCFDQRMASEFSTWEGLVLICGRYEGVDERICQDFIDYEVSVGDFILTGGELAAMIIIDAVTRLIPGVLGGEESALRESFADNLLEHAHYTRPREYEGRAIPEVLLSGNHGEIERWRLETALIRTVLKRPDLLKERTLSSREVEVLKKWCDTIETIIATAS
jgi:tRNA (guanine37-N1)-methyltransferase